MMTNEELETELKQSFRELKTDIRELRIELKTDIRELRLDFREQIQRIRLAVWLPVVAAAGQILFIIFHK